MKIKLLLNITWSLTLFFGLNFTAHAATITITTDTYIGLGNAVNDNADIVVSGCTLTVDGSHAFASLTLNNSAVLTHSPYGTGSNSTLRLDLTISGNMTVDASSRVDASGRGYVGTSSTGNGPGGGTGTRGDGNGGGGGGAFGGNGGAPQSIFAGGQAYGNATEPVQHGSAGGAGYAGIGGPGGGYVRIDVGGTLQLNGQILADGLSGLSHSYGAAGGGAGGGIWLSANQLAGSGQVSANGGAGHEVGEEDSGGGGGGRIAVICQSSTFNGTMTAHGGACGIRTEGSGGAGTVFYKSSAADTGLLLIENGGLEGGISTWVQTTGFGDLSIDNAANVELLGADSMLVPGDILIDDTASILCRSVNTDAQVDNAWQGTGVTITGSTLRVEVGGLISANGQGYTGTSTTGNGPGGGTGTRSDTPGGGGGGALGGNGGNPQSPYAGGIAYGSVTQPLDLGSAGGAGYPADGASGGGAIKIVAETLELEGDIQANGSTGAAHSYGASGGGAGGSVWLELDTFSGSGLLSVNGGDAYIVGEEDGGGGGGGRIAIHYASNTFAGQLQAYGGLCGNGVTEGQAGGAGTIYLESDAQTAGNLIVDNLATNGAATPWPYGLALDETTVGSGGILEVSGTNSWAGSSLNITDGGTMHMRDAATLVLDSFIMASNALVYCHGMNTSALVDGEWAGRGVTLEAQSADIGSGAVITADGLGYTGTSTNGFGPGGATGTRQDWPGGGGGGAYGGHGGNPESPLEGGIGYGSVAQPLDLGSAGGAGYAGDGVSGGGAFRLVVSGVCSLDGLITARGLNGPSHSFGGGGGGAGGSVWIATGSITGSGSVDVRGGNGAVVSEQDGGGGGGGRIAVEADANTFSGSLLAQGGGGFERGGAGTIYIRTAPQTVGDVFVDNGDQTGARTVLSNDESYDHVQVLNAGILEQMPGVSNSVATMTVKSNATVAVQGGAVLYADALTIEDDGVVLCESADNSATVNSNWVGYGAGLQVGTLTIDVGGVLTATGLGYTSTDAKGNGPGGGSGTRSDNNGGGGGGGYGGAGYPGQGQPGGGTYGSETAPVDLGSAGGAGYAGRGGGGGGAIRIIATDEVVVEGLLSANGVDGLVHSWGASGGGAGGSIWITTPTLSGSLGSIQAVGGAGWVVGEEDSGGGGGGRIAIYYQSNQFSGILTADGGSNGGQVGTVHLEEVVISVNLTVQSALGSPVPSVGSRPYTGGSVVPCSVADVISGNMQYECIGWTGTGSVPVSGNSNSVEVVITQNSSITWLWQTNVWLDVNVTGNGSVSHSDGWYAEGSVQNLVATPGEGWLFMGWSGDASGTNNAVLTMDAPRVVMAVFSDDADGDGLTNIEEANVGSNPWLVDTDGDGFDDKQEVDHNWNPTVSDQWAVDHIAANGSTFGLYPSNAVLDVALGEMLMDVAGTEATLSLQLETSQDLNTWSNAGPAQIWSWPVDGEKKYFRVKSSK
ncbi:hypothetical protein PDESU_05636 [Pontiella desulfatans]|uniref:Bacterial repeat domain-containing protein n=1 Tax=Pontiella desulfatans TaxID=2750659 RepID=A0A6C2UAA8_PONDE|nr:hypothetical protein [Pontiella desulfatans]VGO17042.1 hypothetical protein PDESU_05636 [Pontiella desulfatans]